MENNKNIEKEILKLELKAITITTIKENKIFVLKNELENIKIFEYPTQKSSDWLYCDEFEQVTDDILLLKCRVYGNRFFNIQNFKISERFSTWALMKPRNILCLEHLKENKFILLDPGSFVSTEWLDHNSFVCIQWSDFILFYKLKKN